MSHLEFFFIYFSLICEVLWENWFYCECLESLGNIARKCVLSIVCVDLICRFKETEEFRTGKPTTTEFPRHFEDDVETNIPEPLNFNVWMLLLNDLTLLAVARATQRSTEERRQYFPVQCARDLGVGLCQAWSCRCSRF
jgi:hypothetical protein